MGDLSGAVGRDGAMTLSGRLSQQPFAPDALKITYQGYNAHGQKAGAFQIELIPLHSPLLRESWLVSFPPLINMFKFSGSSCSSSALCGFGFFEFLSFQLQAVAFDGCGGARLVPYQNSPAHRKGLCTVITLTAYQKLVPKLLRR